MYGLIDSGLGAIGVVKEYKLENFIILMDKAFFPYGRKSKFFLLCRSIYLCDYLFNYCDNILLACNTLSIIVLPFLKLKYKDKIRGIIDNLLIYSNKDTLFLGTSNTIKYLNKSYYPYPCLECDELIRKIEKKEDTAICIQNIDNIIPKGCAILLGCTHFLNIKDKFNHQTIVPKNPFILP